MSSLREEVGDDEKNSAGGKRRSASILVGVGVGVGDRVPRKGEGKRGGERVA